MDLNKLTIGDRVILLAGTGFLVASLLPWYAAEFTLDYLEFLNGLDFLITGVVPVVLIALTMGVVLLTRFADLQLPQLPLPLSQVLIAPSGLATVLVFFRLLLGDGLDGIDLSRRFGLFLALLTAIGVCVGAFLKMQEDDGTPTHGSTPPQPF